MKTIATAYLLISSFMSPAIIVTAKHSKVVVTSFDDIKLTPENEIAPCVGAEFAFGIAKVSIEFDASSRTKWRACVTTHVEGFIPGLLHIHNGEIFENGKVVVNFSDLLSKDDVDFHGCRGISKTLYDQMISKPVSGGGGDLHYSNISNCAGCISIDCSYDAKCAYLIVNSHAGLVLFSPLAAVSILRSSSI